MKMIKLSGAIGFAAACLAACSAVGQGSSSGAPPSPTAEVGSSVSTGAPAGPSPASDSKSPLIDPQMIVLPIDAYVYGGETGRSVRLRVGRLIADCMTEKGWKYEPSDPAGIVNDSEPNTVGALEKYRLEVGYGIFQTRQTSLASEDPNAEYVSSLTGGARAQFDLDLYGASGEGAVYPEGEEQGCFAVSDVKIRNHLPSSGAVPEELAKRIESDLIGSSAFQDSLKLWHECLAQSGYVFSNQNEILNYLGGLGQELQSEELRIAQLDWNCYRKTMLIPVAKIEVDLIQRLVESGDIPPPTKLGE